MLKYKFISYYNYNIELEIGISIYEMIIVIVILLIGALPILGCIHIRFILWSKSFKNINVRNNDNKMKLLQNIILYYKLG